MVELSKFRDLCRENQNVVLLTECNDGTIARFILRTIDIFEKVKDKEEIHMDRYDYAMGDKYNEYIKEEFDLDMNNRFHCMLWENWLCLLCELDLIDIGTRYYWPGNYNYTKSDIDYLKSFL